MLKDLVLFRHAKAVRPFEAADDESRNLAPRGRTDSARMAARLAAAGFVPDVALVSTAARTRQTWDIARAAFAPVDARWLDTLYLASPDTCLAAARSAAAGSVVLVGHDPGLHDLACRLAQGQTDSTGRLAVLRQKLPTAGVAWFTADPGCASGFRFTAFLSPKDPDEGLGSNDRQPRA